MGLFILEGEKKSFAYIWKHIPLPLPFALQKVSPLCLSVVDRRLGSWISTSPAPDSSFYPPEAERPTEEWYRQEAKGLPAGGINFIILFHQDKNWTSVGRWLWPGRLHGRSALTQPGPDQSKLNLFIYVASCMGLDPNRLHSVIWHR